MKIFLFLCLFVFAGLGCVNSSIPNLVFTEPKNVYRQIDEYEGKETVVRGVVRVMPAFCTLKACVMDDCKEGDSMVCNSCGATALLEDEDSGEQLLLEAIDCSMDEIWHCGNEMSYAFSSCGQGLIPDMRIEVRGIVREQFAGPIHLEQARVIRELEDFE